MQFPSGGARGWGEGEEFFEGWCHLIIFLRIIVHHLYIFVHIIFVYTQDYSRIQKMYPRDELDMEMIKHL